MYVGHLSLCLFEELCMHNGSKSCDMPLLCAISIKVDILFCNCVVSWKKIRNSNSTFATLCHDLSGHLHALVYSIMYQKWALYNVGAVYDY